jgi:ABC-type branched-subunit amino acid transport system permease subunit
MDILVAGLVIGMGNALLAMGLVLVYMSNRVINLAHGELGAFAVAMMLALTRSAHLNYWLALLLSLSSAGALAAMIERSILRRLFKSPRLILLIATIGIAQLIIVFRLLLPKPSAPGGGKEKALFGGGNVFPVPFTIHPVRFGRVVLGSEHFIALVIGPLIALAVVMFLRHSSYGVALRASAQNMARARLLGIPVTRVSTLAWVIAGLMSGAASILLAPIIGFSSTEAVGLPILMRGLAAAMAGRMESVGTAFGVGLMLGVLDQLVFFWTGRSGLTDIVLFVVILVTLLSRRGVIKRTVAAEESSWEVAEPQRNLPVEIARHPKWRWVVVAVTAIGAALVLGNPLLLGDSAVFFLATVLLVSVVAVSATVLTGWAGQMSIGQWALAGVGGVFGAKLVVSYEFPFWLALVVAAVAGGAVALVIGLPALRLEGTALAVVTLGFAVASAGWLFEQPWFRGAGFMLRPDFMSTRIYYFVALGFLLVTIYATRAFQRTRVGRNMIAVRDNPLQASAMGVPIVRTKLTAFVFAGVLAGGAGFLWSTGIGLADDSVFGVVRSLTIVSAVVIGGLGSVTGAIIGAFYLMGIPYFGAKISPYLGLLASGAGLLFLVILLPGGLARLLFGARDLIAKAVTGIEVRPVVEQAPAGLETVAAELASAPELVGAEH